MQAEQDFPFACGCVAGTVWHQSVLWYYNKIFCILGKWGLTRVIWRYSKSNVQCTELFSQITYRAPNCAGAPPIFKKNYVGPKYVCCLTASWFCWFCKDSTAHIVNQDIRNETWDEPFTLNASMDDSIHLKVSYRSRRIQNIPYKMIIDREP